MREVTIVAALTVDGAERDIDLDRVTKQLQRPPRKRARRDRGET